MQNKVVLLGIVAVLAFVRFAVVPWHEYQQSKYQQLDAVTKRLQRSEALVEQQQRLIEMQQQQQQQLATMLTPFPKVTNPSAYRLQLQQQIQQLAEENGVAVTFFDWLSDTPMQVFSLSRGRISLRLKGLAGNIMSTHSLIEQRFPNFIVRDVKANWRNDLTPQSEIELSLLVEVDYQEQEAQ